MEPGEAPTRSRRHGQQGREVGAELTLGAEAEAAGEERPRRQRKSGPTLGLDGTPVRGARLPDETAAISFMHPSEREFAKLLDYYGIKYLYEPRSFPLRWEGNRVVEMHSPDFYLPEQDQYFELTTMKQSLVTQKNRKLREVRELYPEINIQLLYRRDYIRLLGKYGYGPMVDAKVEGIGSTLFTEEQLLRRVREIAAQITKDYAGQEPVLVGVLRGASIFLADLIRAIDLPTELAFMSVSRYGGEHTGAVEVLRDVEVNVEGRPVILVEGLVDTGLTLRPIMQHLEDKGLASLDVCAMFDKRARRVIDVPIRYLGFEVPDEFIVGYGLDYNERYRNLPHIATLRVIEPKAIAQR
jgi:hypoxanthine phosphoribosyltransferase